MEKTNRSLFELFEWSNRHLFSPKIYWTRPHHSDVHNGTNFVQQVLPRKYKETIFKSPSIIQQRISYLGKIQILSNIIADKIQFKIMIYCKEKSIECLNQSIIFFFIHSTKNVRVRFFLQNYGSPRQRIARILLQKHYRKKKKREVVYRLRMPLVSFSSPFVYAHRV